MPRRQSTTIIRRRRGRVINTKRVVRSSTRRRRPQKRNNKRRAGPLRFNNPPQGRTPSIVMPEYTKNYIEALCDPVNSKPAGIPVGPTIPSEKFRCFARVSFSTGTLGHGHITVEPWRMAINDSAPANPIIRYTDSSWAGTNGWTAPGPGIISAATNSNSPYSSADFGPAPLAQFRLVACSLRVRYAGSELNRGGLYHLIQQPEHEAISTFSSTIDESDQFANTKRVPIKDSEWVTIIHCPTNSIDGFGTAYIEAVSGGEPDSDYMGVWVDSAVPQQPFEAEIWAHIEIVGRNLRATSPSQSDPVGLEAAKQAMNATGGSVTCTPQVLKEAVMSAVKENVVSQETHIGFADLIDFGSKAINFATTAAPYVAAGLALL